jgi:hypothetical protein
MQTFSIAAFAVATLLATTFPSHGSAAAPGNTITLQSYGIYEFDGGDTSQPNHSELRISFRNDGDVAATAVTFDILTDGKYAGRIDDVGTFTKGATIDHSFRWVDVRHGQSLEVAQVRYADGSVWTNDTLPPAPRRQAR